MVDLLITHDYLTLYPGHLLINVLEGTTVAMIV